jgi:hypothetical protein
VLNGVELDVKHYMKSAALNYQSFPKCLPGKYTPVVDSMALIQGLEDHLWNGGQSSYPKTPQIYAESEKKLLMLGGVFGRFKRGGNLVLIKAFPAMIHPSMM